jgi:hypothetical protein
MKSNDYFLQNQEDEIFSPIDLNLVRAQLLFLNPTDGSFFVIQNKLRVGEFFQCISSSTNSYLVEVKSLGKLYQCKSITSLKDTIILIEQFIEDTLVISKKWIEIIL